MKIKLYPWLINTYKKIVYSYTIRRGHHALLFHSQWDNGSNRLINLITRWLICDNPHDQF